MDSQRLQRSSGFGEGCAAMRDVHRLAASATDVSPSMNDLMAVISAAEGIPSSSAMDWNHSSYMATALRSVRRLSSISEYDIILRFRVQCCIRLALLSV